MSTPYFTSYFTSNLAPPRLCCAGMVMLQLLTGIDSASVVSMVEAARADSVRFPAVLDKRAGAWPAAEAVAFADLALKCVEFR